MSPHWLQGMQNTHLRNVSAAKPYLEVGEGLFIFHKSVLGAPFKIYKEFSFKLSPELFQAKLPTWSVECLSLQAFLEPQVVDQP